jgi:hypothetical protein
LAALVLVSKQLRVIFDFDMSFEVLGRLSSVDTSCYASKHVSILTFPRALYQFAIGAGCSHTLSAVIIGSEYQSESMRTL